LASLGANHIASNRNQAWSGRGFVYSFGRQDDTNLHADLSTIKFALKIAVGIVQAAVGRKNQPR
jgi:hypothetical protein